MTSVGWMELSYIIGYGVVIFALWRTPVLFPFKLITVLIHEMGHALAALVTGGKIEGIEITADEGGACHLSGGKLWLILPAGYLGSSIFGAFLILLSMRHFTAQIAAAILGVGLVAAMWWAKNWLNRFLTIGAMVLLAFAWWFERGLVLRYLIGFIGTMSSLYAIYDIYDDTIRRSVSHSDASLMAEKTGIPAIAWGILWCIFSSVLLFASVYYGIKWKQ